MTGDLAFIPLGGTGEIGLNLNLYRCDGQLLAVVRRTNERLRRAVDEKAGVRWSGCS